MLKILNKNGYDAFLVGGYVRDFLLSKKTNDIDICTNATPDEVKSILKLNFKEENYGCLSIYLDNKNVQITTFRKEKEYLKRKPIDIDYILDVKEDLQRRDFTINALLMDKEMKIIDYVNGKKDLENKIIRSIGNANEKFKEDPLRMLRAIRFACTLDFDIEKNTLSAIKSNYKLVKSLSNERIKEEIDKILTSPNFNKGLNYLKETNIESLLNINYNDVVYVNSLLGMYAQISIDIEFSKNDIKNISKIRQMILSKSINNIALFNNGIDLCLIAGEILNFNKKDIIKAYKTLPIKKMDDIKITGKEIMELLSLEPSSKISDIIYDLKKSILCGKIKNTKKSIINYLKEKYE